MKQAMFYTKIQGDRVQCFLCPHHCIILQDGFGLCRARKNIEGELFSVNYGKITAIAMDPIEKKPLAKFQPRSQILSVGTFGCNLKCPFCQNWSIAHEMPAIMDVTPAMLVQKAKEQVENGNIGIAYTYNEPMIWYEYVYDTARMAKQAGLKNVLVTNGFVSKEPLEELLPYIDAMNIDIKAFTHLFYQDICQGGLENVKETIAYAAKRCHVEVTTLVIPGLNDSPNEIMELSAWLASISKDIPFHLTRFFPHYKMSNTQITPIETLNKAKEIALKHLKYVYLGNV